MNLTIKKICHYQTYKVFLFTIPSEMDEASYILDGLAMNKSGKWTKEYYADTGGFTGHVFAMSSLLGY